MTQFNEISYLLIIMLLSTSVYCNVQSDTTIDNRTYKIIEKYENGSVKLIGQFGTNCLDDSLRKHGYFIRFDESGNEESRELYFFDEKRNMKILGLKHGWWGWYGATQKHFVGVKITKPYIVAPCF